MLVRFLLFYLMVTGPGTLGVDPLSGQHLRVLGMEFLVALTVQRNETGHVVHVDGVQSHMIEALSRMLNFSYSYLDITTSFTDDVPSARGGIYYLDNDLADYFLSTAVLTSKRYQKADFPASWYYGRFSTIMPYPEETSNLAASFTPLSYQVWILIGVAVVTTTLFLTYLKRRKTLTGQITESDSNEGRHATEEELRYQESTLLYVMGNLFSQGQRYLPKPLAIRLAAGAWCCTCFFLIQIYCSTLTSHLTKPNQKPLVDSFFQVADTPGVTLTIDRGLAIDQLLQIVESSDHLKRFTGDLKKDNRLITCNRTAVCLEHVKSGSAVYSAPIDSLSVIMANDLKSSKGTCQYTRTKETFWATPVFTVLRKNSPYTKSLSKGILRLRETGLLDKWEKMYVPSTSKCMKVNERKGMPRLSLQHLSSPFVILIAGCLISVFVFIVERIAGKLNCFNRSPRVVIV